MTEPWMVRMVQQLPSGRAESTIADLLDWCVREGINPSNAHVSGGHLIWERPETDDERVEREAAIAASQARTDAWERNNLARLLAKHGLPEGWVAP